MYPTKVVIEDRVYEINTDFRVAIECNAIAQSNIDDTERALAIIYKLFGDKGLDNPQDYQTLLEKAKKYLSMGKEIEETNEEPDMDFEQDMSYIIASFRSDYSINLNTEKLHWWEFYDLLNGLSNSDMGNCCVLNRIRNLRNMDLSEIKDAKEQEKIRKAQESVALKPKEKPKTERQKELDEYWKQALKKGE